MTDREEQIDNEEFFHFDGQVCFFGDTLFKPLVWMGESFKKGFNTVAIPVSLVSDSDLSFELAFMKATEAKEQGFKIVFDIDLGLFDRLKMPLESDSLFSTLVFSIDLFRTSLLEPFSSITLGVIAYKGSADFYSLLRKDYSLIESFSLWYSSAYKAVEVDPLDLEKTSDGKAILTQGFFEMGMRFIEKVTDVLPSNIPIFVLIDFQDVEGPALKAFLLNRERLGRVLIVPKNADLLYFGMSWEGIQQDSFANFSSKELPIHRENPQETSAVLLPSIEDKKLTAYKEIGDAIDFFLANSISFRLVPEALFISEWDAINLLFVREEMSKEGLRMVKGYLASQGPLVVLGKAECVPGAIEFKEWKEKFLLNS